MAGRDPSVGAAMRHMGHLLAERADGGRLVRGHELFEDGYVHDVEFGDGIVTATVYGTRREPYRVMMRHPGTGTLPESSRPLRFDCSCPDWGDPCKHGVALALVFAEHLDHDPTAVDDSPSLSDLVPAERQPVVLKPTVERPTWAESVETPAPVTNLGDWLGTSTPPTRPLGLGGGDPIGALLDLGPLRVGSVDAAPGISLLVMRLLDDE
jgi:SWIM zinc finger